MTTPPEALRPTWMEINLSALEANAAILRAHTRAPRLMAVLKANAYGHGILECAQVLERARVDYFGVALVEEGIALRAAGIITPILVFGGIAGSQISLFLDYNLDLTASSVDKLRAIDATAQARGCRARVHLKIDTGMGRIGVRPESASALIAAAEDARAIDVVGVFTHFFASDEADPSSALSQLEQFLECTHTLPASVLRHAANSAAVLQLPEAALDMIRPGVALYGVAPARHLEGALPLHPVMKVRSEVVFFKVARRGTGVGYGPLWRAPEDTRVVTVPIGYGDGYARHLSNRAEVLIRGRRYPVVGSVCMDQIMVNIAHGEAYNGDEVVLIGSQHGERISVTEIAERAGTVPHEILATLNLRIPRRYVREAPSSS